MSSKKHENSEQAKLFIETARALECDEDKARFEAKLKRIAKASPGRPAARKPRGK